MSSENIVGIDGKKSRMDPKARPAKIITFEEKSVKDGGQPEKLGTGTQYPTKPPGPPPVKKS